MAAVGWPWTSVLAGERVPPAPRAALAYLVGTAATTLSMLALAYAKLGIYRRNVAAAMVVLFVAGLVLERRRRRPDASPPVAGRLSLALPGLAVTGLALATAVVDTVRQAPPNNIDFIRAWGVKALYIAYHHNLLFNGVAPQHRYYPLEVTNLYAGDYLFLGHINDSVIRLLILLFGVSTAVAVWWFARRLMPPAAASAAVVLAVATPQFVLHLSKGLADLEVASYVVIAVLASHRWVLDGGARYAGLAGVAAGAAAWCKVEGALTCGVLLLTVLVLRRRLITPGAGWWLGWFLLFVLPWEAFVRLHHMTFSNRHFATVYLHVGWIVKGVGGALLARDHWGVFWPLALGTIVLLAPIWWRTRIAPLVWLAVPNVILTMGAYVTHYRTGNQGSIDSTASRLYLHIGPAVGVAAAGAAALAWAWLRAAPEPPGEQPGRPAPGAHPADAAPARPA